MHIEFLVEEESCAEALRSLVPKIVGETASFGLHFFQGKPDLLKKLPERLAGYANWLTDDYRIVVLVDRDNDDCKNLKAQLDEIAAEKGLKTRSTSRDKRRFHVMNRIAVEELEAWFLGDVEALSAAYPRVPGTLGKKRGYHDPDAIRGGTWEALERTLRKAGYYSTGMPKIEVARNVAARMDPSRNRSHSFQVFRDGLRDMVG
jgi:hypothetical protein